MGILWPHSNTAPRTNADRRAPGALAYFFEAGTTTPRTTYQDADLTTPHAHPVIADAYGRFPAVFVDFGAYRERVKTAGNTQLWDTDDIPNPAPFDAEVGVDENALLQTGQFIFELIDGTRVGFVRANGRTIGSATSGASERANADCAGLFERLYNALPNSVCPVSGGRGVNAGVDFAANKTLTLPDLRGSGPFGLDTMGNGAAARFDASVPFLVGNATAPGSTAGGNHVTLTEAMIPAHLHAVNITSTAGGAHGHTFSSGLAASNGAHTHTIDITDPGHTHSSNGALVKLNASGNLNLAIGASGDGAGGVTSNSTGITASSQSNGAHTHTVTGTISSQVDHQHTVSGNTGSTGSGGAHNNLSRAVLGTWYIKL